MGKLKNAMYDFDEMEFKVEWLESLSYLLWESMAEGDSEAHDKQTMGAYVLKNEVEALHEQMKEINKRLRECLKEAKV